MHLAFVDFCSVHDKNNYRNKPKEYCTFTHTHTHTRLTALFSGTTQVRRYQKGETNLDFTEARDS